MKNIFTDHPHSIGETYWQHLCYAWLTGLKMIFAGVLCIIHAIFPFLFPTAASSILLKMTEDFVVRMPKAEARIKNLAEVMNKKINSI